jgi:hypothetical protein
MNRTIGRELLAVENPDTRALHGIRLYCSYAPISGAERTFAESVELHVDVTMPIIEEHDWFACPPTVQFVAVEPAPISGDPAAGARLLGAFTNSGAAAIEFASNPVAVRHPARSELLPPMIAPQGLPLEQWLWFMYEIHAR